MTKGRLGGAWVEDAAISEARIEESPPEIRALFREYETNQVLAALTAAGINDHPSKFTKRQLEEGVQIAATLLYAERHRRQQETFGEHF